MGIKARVIPRFPASVKGAGSMVVEKKNGIFTIYQNPFYPLGDAPHDGNLYVRINGGWQQGGGVVATKDNPPANPINGQLWWETDTGVTYVWYDDGNSSQWVQLAGGATSPAVVTTADAPPANPVDGQIWWESDSGLAYIWYDDGNSAQWVQMHAMEGPKGDAGPAGPPGPPGGLGEAPTDGQTYGRKGSTNQWIALQQSYTAAQITFTPVGNVSSVTTQNAIAELDSEKVAKAGDIMSGDLQIAKSEPRLYLNKSSPNQNSGIGGLSGGVPRWTMLLGDSSPEATGDAGSNFALYSYNDAGAVATERLRIERDSGGMFGVFPAFNFWKNAFYAAHLATSGNISYNSVINTAGTDWIGGGTAGYGALQAFNPANGLITFYASAVTPSAPIASWIQTLSIDRSGNLTAAGNLSAVNISASGGISGVTGSFSGSVASAGFNSTGGISAATVLTVGGTATMTGSALNLASGQYFYGNNGSGSIVLTFSASNFFAWNTSTGLLQYVATGGGGFSFEPTLQDFRVTNTASKPGGGVWADSSDERIKDIKGQFTRGLNEVAQLTPVVYTFKGNDTLEPSNNQIPYDNSPHYTVAEAKTEFTGLVAQAVEEIFPEMVKRRNGYIDGKAVDDLRDIDAMPLIFALVNAIKELKQRIETLEAR